MRGFDLLVFAAGLQIHRVYSMLSHGTEKNMYRAGRLVGLPESFGCRLSAAFLGFMIMVYLMGE